MFSPGARFSKVAVAFRDPKANLRLPCLYSRSNDTIKLSVNEAKLAGLVCELQNCATIQQDLIFKFA